MTEQELYTHIETDPDNIGLSWSLADDDLMKLLHDATLGLEVEISTPKYHVLQWAGGNGLLDRLAKNQDVHLSDQIRSICRAAMLMFADGTIGSINFNEPQLQALLDALIAGGVMTAEEKAELMAGLAHEAANTLDKAFGVGTRATEGFIERARKAGA